MKSEASILLHNKHDSSLENTDLYQESCGLTWGRRFAILLSSGCNLLLVASGISQAVLGGLEKDYIRLGIGAGTSLLGVLTTTGLGAIIAYQNRTTNNFTSLNGVLIEKNNTLEEQNKILQKRVETLEGTCQSNTSELEKSVQIQAKLKGQIESLTKLLRDPEIKDAIKKVQNEKKENSSVNSSFTSTISDI